MPPASLRIDTDGGIEAMWADSGMRYFRIKKTDLERAHFDDGWMILQCT